MRRRNARAVGRQLIAIDDPPEALDFVVSVVTDVHTRTARLAPALFGGANSDPELDRYLGDSIAGINGQVRRVLDIFRDRGWLRVDVPSTNSSRRPPSSAASKPTCASL